MGSGRARGPGTRSLGGKEREGELGREQPGQGTKLGEDADSAHRSAMAMAWRAGARVAAVQRQESWFGASLGAARWLGPGARHLSAQVAGAGVRRRRWTWCRETEVEDAGRGNFVNKTKFKNQFCNFNFSPSSWPQMKKF